MSYATLQQLETRFTARLLLDLTDRAHPPTGAVDAAIIEQALVDTDAVIDGYLAGRYLLPLTAVPPMLADLAQVIAIYKLHTYEPNKKIVTDYENALTTLKDIAKGVVRLPLAGIDAGGEPQSSGASGVVATDRQRPLTPENMTGFI